MKKKLTGELIRYLVFGVLTTVVNFVVYFGCNAVLGKGNYLVSNVIAWVAAVTFAYITNKLYVFSSKSWDRRTLLKELPGFFAARLFSLGVEEAGLYLMIDVLHFDLWSWDLIVYDLNGATFAKLVMQFVVIVLNYVFSKWLIFARRKEG